MNEAIEIALGAAQGMDPETLARAAMEANKEAAPLNPVEIELKTAKDAISVLEITNAELKTQLDEIQAELARVKEVIKPLFNAAFKGRYGSI